MWCCRQQKQRIASSRENLGQSPSLRVFEVLLASRLTAMMCLIDDNNIVVGAVELIEGLFLLEEVNRNASERDRVERVRAEFGAAAHFIEFRAIDDLHAQAESLEHLEFPLFEQRAGRRDNQNQVSEPPGEQLREQQACLNGLAQADGVG
jgi:hypothetical protein